jgi:hypothetical protein
MTFIPSVRFNPPAKPLAMQARFSGNNAGPDGVPYAETSPQDLAITKRELLELGLEERASLPEEQADESREMWMGANANLREAYRRNPLGRLFGR